VDRPKEPRKDRRRRASSQEAWRAQTIRHIRILARRLGRPPTFADYLVYRQTTNANLPAGTTLFRLFGKFTTLRDLAGVSNLGPAAAPQMSNDEMLEDLRYVASQLGTDTLSTHAYDRFRKPDDTRPDFVAKRPLLDGEGNVVGEKELCSSSVMRKRFGYWSAATAAAGLRSSERTLPPRPTAVDAVEALRLAKEQVAGRLSPQAYSEWWSSLAGEHERNKLPTPQEILEFFPSWEIALKVADIEQRDAFHPKALYKASEVRRIVRRCEELMRARGKPADYELTPDDYEWIRARSRKPLPEWSVIQELLRV
jgi:hypothetical protein